MHLEGRVKRSFIFLYMDIHIFYLTASEPCGKDDWAVGGRHYTRLWALVPACEPILREQESNGYSDLQEGRLDILAREVVRIFKALSDATRVEILRLLGEAPRNVTELTSLVGVSQPKVSRHLKILRDAGILVDVRRGKWVWYELAAHERGGATSTAISAIISIFSEMTSAKPSAQEVGSRPSAARRVAQPGARRVVQLGARPVAQPGARPVTQPGARSLAQPGAPHRRIESPARPAPRQVGPDTGGIREIRRRKRRAPAQQPVPAKKDIDDFLL